MSVPSPTSLARKAIQIEVALLRSPLLIADRVAARLGASSVVRSPVRTGLVALDAVAQRVETLPTTTASPARPTRPRATSGAAPTVGPDDERIEQVAEELLDEQELAPLTGELADNDELRRVQAELNAKRLLDEQHPPPDDDGWAPSGSNRRPTD